MGTARARNIGTASAKMAKARHLVSIGRKAPGQRHVKARQYVLQPLPPPQPSVLVLPSNRVFGRGSGPPPQTPKQYVAPIPDVHDRLALQCRSTTV
jgi:hypothetical protein